MIAARPYTRLEVLKEIFEKLVDSINLKLILANAAIFFTWAFDGKIKILQTVFTLVILDIITGVWAVLKLQGWSQFKSRELIVGPIRFGVYLTLIYVSISIDKSFPIAWALPIMNTFIVCTEAKSIFENFGKLGFPVPTLLLSKLKSFNEKKE